MADTSRVLVTLTVHGASDALHAVEAALHADWARVLTHVQDDACCTYIVDISTPTARTELLPLLVRDPDTRAKVVATSAEAPDKGFVEDAQELQPPADSAAETVVRRLGERYRVELDHKESDLRSHDVHVVARVYPGRLPGGVTAPWRTD